MDYQVIEALVQGMTVGSVVVQILGQHLFFEDSPAGRLVRFLHLSDGLHTYPYVAAAPGSQLERHLQTNHFPRHSVCRIDQCLVYNGNIAGSDQLVILLWDLTLIKSGKELERWIGHPTTIVVSQQTFITSADSTFNTTISNMEDLDEFEDDQGYYSQDTSSSEDDVASLEMSSHSMTEYPEFVLPKKFAALYSIFTEIDRQLTICHSRRTTYFHHLRQQMGLQYEDLAHIMAIFPKAYVLKMQKLSGVEAAPSSSKEGMILWIRDESGVDSALNPPSLPLSSRERDIRKKRFHAALLSIVHQHHSRFLKSLGRSEGVEVEGWHPDFPLEEVDLPKPAELSVFTPPRRISAAAELLAKFKLDRTPTKQEMAAARKKLLPRLMTSPTFGKLDREYRQKVVENEARREAVQLKRDPAEEKRQSILHRIPGMARIILNIFSSKRKRTLPLAEVEELLKGSMKMKLSPVEFREHMSMLLDIFYGRWLYHFTFLRSKLNLKIVDESIGLNEIDAIVKEEMEKKPLKSS